MSTEAAVTLVIAAIIDVVFVALTLAMRFGGLIDVCTPYGTDTPEHRRKIGRERAKLGASRMLYTVLAGAAVMTAAAFFEAHMALLTCAGLAIMLISVAAFLVWYRRNTR